MSSDTRSALLRLLQQDARMSSSVIAEQLGLSESEVESMIAELQASGVIVRFTAVINDENLSDVTPRVRALIELEIRPEKGVGFDKLAKRIARYPSVIDQYLISGRYDFLVIVEEDSLQAVARFVSEKLAGLENVKATTTHFILKKYKIKGAIMDVVESAERLVVSP